MTGRTLLANILWRTAVVAAVITVSITGSIAIEQDIAGANRSHQNFQAQINALNKEVSALQKADASSSAKEAQQFVGEINYICTTEGELAQINHLPLPSPGLCDLVLPPAKS